MPPDIPAESGSDPSADVADLLHAVDRRIRRASRQALEPLGITPGQARALRTLARHGAPLRMSGLADRLRIARRSATTVVDELHERGLVERRPDPDDRRAVAVALTAPGREMVGTLERGRREAASRLTARLGARDLASLAALLRRLDDDPAPDGSAG